MSPLFGMAGLAEAVEAQALLLGYCGLLLVGTAAAAGLLLRSRGAAVVAVALAGLVTLAFMPWAAFAPVASDDPDVLHWAAAWQLFAKWWAAALAAVIVTAVRAFRRPGPSPVLRDGQVDECARAIEALRARTAIDGPESGVVPDPRRLRDSGGA